MCCGAAAEDKGRICMNPETANCWSMSKGMTRLGRLGSEHPPVVRAGRESLAGLGRESWKSAVGKRCH